MEAERRRLDLSLDRYNSLLDEVAVARPPEKESEIL